MSQPKPLDLDLIRSREAKLWPQIQGRPGDLGCWIWTGRRTKAGYGQVRYRVGRNGDRKVIAYPAHRVIFALIRGYDPGLDLDHKCRRHECVNPECLEPATDRLNTIRGESPVGQAMRKRLIEGKCLHDHALSEVGTSKRGECMECNRERDRKRAAERWAAIKADPERHAKWKANGARQARERRRR